MIREQWHRLCRAVLGGFLIGSGAIGFAQDGAMPGVVRITDRRPQGAPVQNASFGGHHSHGEYIDGGVVTGDCPSDAGFYGGPDCYGKHGCYGKHSCLFGPGCLSGHCCCLREHYGSLSPDNGFSLPAKYPIQRRGVQYTAYFPRAWYGNPGGGLRGDIVYPQVYQPTDTTQLGYYYQHVPFWMPNPNALPPRPIPAQWHTYAPAARGGHFGGGFGYGGSGYGNGFCPTDGSVTIDGTPISPTPATITPAPGQPQTVPATPQLEQGPPPSAPPVESAPPARVPSAKLPILRAAY